MSEKERYFIMAEIYVLGKRPDGLHSCVFTDTPRGSYPEIIRAHPSRIIPASRLRYGWVRANDPIRKGMFLNKKMDWTECSIGDAHGERLILDPEPEEKDEWDEWIDNAPMALLSHPGIKDWLKRMPRKDK